MRVILRPSDRFAYAGYHRRAQRGVAYTGGTSKVSEHGGFAYDDHNVPLIVSNTSYSPSTYTGTVENAAGGAHGPRIRSPHSAGRSKEGTEVLLGLPFTGGKK